MFAGRKESRTSAFRRRSWSKKSSGFSIGRQRYCRMRSAKSRKLAFFTTVARLNSERMAIYKICFLSPACSLSFLIVKLRQSALEQLTFKKITFLYQCFKINLNMLSALSLELLSLIIYESSRHCHLSTNVNIKMREDKSEYVSQTIIRFKSKKKRKK